MEKKYKVVFDGFETEEQAEIFADWYEGQGEQDINSWLESSRDLKYITVDVDKVHKSGGFKANDVNEVIVPLKLSKKED